MGKTASGAVWLDPDKTSPYEFYQYWRNVGDDDVIKCIKMLTFLPLDEIKKMEGWEGSELNRAKEILAFELTALVHSKDEAEKAQETARGLFSAGGAADMPTAELTEADLADGAIDILAILVKSGLCPSKSEARRAVEQGGVEAAGEKVAEFTKSFTAAELTGDGIVVKRGKKNFKRVVLK
jgi:tyrosyl-tRNA synthetase